MTSLYMSNAYLSIWDGKNKTLARMIMEEHLGRELTSNEYVHHIDRDTLNDELSNLRVVSPSEHRILHQKPASDETREKLSKAGLGRVKSEEERENISKAAVEGWKKRSRIISKEASENMSRAQVERHERKRERSRL